MTTLLAPPAHTAVHDAAVRYAAAPDAERPQTVPPRATPPPVPGRSFIPVRDALWRIVDPAGVVIGYLERHPGVDGDRFSARLVVFATRTRDLGVFCRIEDAVDCFR